MSPAPPANPPPRRVGEEITRFFRWLRQEPWPALLLGLVVATLVYFLWSFPAFYKGAHSALQWAMSAWNAENNQEHSFLVLPIAAFLLWHHRREIEQAAKAPSNAGIFYALGGVILFVVAVRSLQPRLALMALPLMIYGGVRFVWGREVGRVFIFPCLFLLFMVPIGGIVQGTVSLQLFVSSAVRFLSALVGVQVQMEGTTLRALDGSFNFEIAEGCSGIRSLMAMTMLAALYVHFTQKGAWKQVIIFAGSVVFALIGNIGRIFTVILFARFISPEIAGGIYHDYSGFIFFPFAVSAMIGFASLVNTDWRKTLNQKMKPEIPAEHDGKPGQKPGPISYDY